MVKPLPLPYKLLSPGVGRLLVSVPHAGRRYDWHTRAGQQPIARLSAQRRGEDPFVDHLAMPLVRLGLPTLIQRAPRNIIDVNRAPWEMAQDTVVADPGRQTSPPPPFRETPKARQGLGLVPTRLGGEHVYQFPLSTQDLEQRIAHYHEPYHAALSASMAASRQRFEQALLLDLHSMPRLNPLPFPAPHFVLGNRYGATCPAWIMALATEALGSQGHSVVCNQPYAGGYIAERHAQPNQGCYVLQVEMCRSLYLTASAQRTFPALRPSQGQMRRILSPRGVTTLQDLLLALVQALNAGLSNPARRSRAAE